MREEITKLLEAYRDSFETGPRAVAGFYTEPSVMVETGVARVSATRRDTEALFVEIDARHRTRRFTHSDILAIDVQPLGSESALATVQWAYKGACEELLWKATCSYHLYRCDGVWKILVHTVHDA